MPGSVPVLALKLIAAEDAELKIRHRLLSCHRNSDVQLCAALEYAHSKAADTRRRAKERLLAVYGELVALG